MTFQSLEYLIFLQVVFILYWTLCRGSKTLQNGLIVAASLVFYGWWDWRFLGLQIGKTNRVIDLKDFTK